MDTYVYRIDRNLYVNLTNKCSNACEFCIRNYKSGIKDYYLWLEREPTEAEVLDLIAKEDRSSFDAVVFCGFGEPTFRADAIGNIGRELRKKGVTVRVNTNGQAFEIWGKDALDVMDGAVDVFSVSLNEDNAKDYNALCHCEFGEKGYETMLAFAKAASERNIGVRFSVMETIGEKKIANCREIARKAGAELLVRKMEP